eukprot:SM000076S21774  [mRNA]  locus=s76:105778:107746:- [translate_table: standard]
MEPALFSLADVFGEEAAPAAGGECEGPQEYEVRQHDFPGKALLVREFGFHRCNANLAWPGARVFSDWLHARRHLLHGRRILELGSALAVGSSGTGALAVYLASVLGADVTTCDYDDIKIEENIAFNCRSNGLAVLPHVRHTWGVFPFPVEPPPWDLILASDILLYVKEYGNLIKTLLFLLREYQRSETEQSAAKLGQPDDKSERAVHRSSDAFGRAELPLPAAMRQGPRESAEGLGLVMTTLTPAAGYRSHGAATGQEAEVGLPIGEASIAGPDTSANLRGAGRGPHPAVGNGRLVPKGVEIDGLARLPIPSFLMSWRRRLPKTETDRFFGGCIDAGLVVKDLGSAVFLIH